MAAASAAEERGASEAVEHGRHEGVARADGVADWDADRNSRSTTSAW